MDGFAKLLKFERLRKTFSDSAREASLEARRAKKEAEADRVYNEKVVRAKTGIPVFSEREEAAQTKLVERTLPEDRPHSGWATKESTEIGGKEVTHAASHPNGSKAQIREISNPFRPKQAGVIANARVEHPRTGVHEKWFDTGPKEQILSAAREWADKKMRGE